MIPSPTVPPMARRPPTSRATPLTAARRALAAALALAVFAVSLVGGARFVWCAPMARAMAHSCCPSTHAAGERPAPAVEPQCCEARRLASLPLTTFDLAPDLAVPPPLAVGLVVFALVLLTALAPRAPPRVRPRLARARAGPRAPLYLRHCALLN